MMSDLKIEKEEVISRALTTELDKRFFESLYNDVLIGSENIDFDGLSVLHITVKHTRYSSS